MVEIYQLLLDGTPLDAGLYPTIASLEVEENMDLPGAVELRVPVDSTPEGELTFVADRLFRPSASLAVVVTAGTRPPECIFDGYLLSHKLHVGTGTTGSSLVVWGQDATWLMGLEEKAREWVDATDSDVAAQIFNEYGITPDDRNASDDSSSHAEAEHSLMQRGTDIQLLRQLARRTGKVCRVSCKAAPGVRIGTFAKADLAGETAVTLALNAPDGPTVSALDFEWDIARPSEVVARQALFDDPAEDGAVFDTAETGLSLLDERGLSQMSSHSMKVFLPPTGGGASETAARATALLRDAGFFVRCSGEADAHRTGAVLRAGMIVEIRGAGSLYSGKYCVWSVRHTFTPEAHKMSFSLVRNALGPAPVKGGLS